MRYERASPETSDGVAGQGSGAHRQIDLGPEEAIPLGQGRAFIVAGRIVGVFRQRDGCLFATDGRCPHRGGPLADGIVGDGIVICPLHGWRIDLASGSCHGERAAVRVYGVRRAGGRVLLLLPED